MSGPTPAPATRADRRFRCPFCKRQVEVGDEIGFDVIKNSGDERTVAVCLDCAERRLHDEHGPYPEDP